MTKYIIKPAYKEVCFLAPLNEEQKISFLKDKFKHESPYGFSMLKISTETDTDPNKVDMI